MTEGRQQLREIKTTGRWTWPALAAEVGVETVTILSYATGRRRPSTRQADRLHRQLGIDPASWWREVAS